MTSERLSLLEDPEGSHSAPNYVKTPKPSYTKPRRPNFSPIPEPTLFHSLNTTLSHPPKKHLHQDPHPTLSPRWLEHPKGRLMGLPECQNIEGI